MRRRLATGRPAAFAAAATSAFSNSASSAASREARPSWSWCTETGSSSLPPARLLALRSRRAGLLIGSSSAGAAKSSSRGCQAPDCLVKKEVIVLLCTASTVLRLLPRPRTVDLTAGLVGFGAALVARVLAGRPRDRPLHGGGGSSALRPSSSAGVSAPKSTLPDRLDCAAGGAPPLRQNDATVGSPSTAGSRGARGFIGPRTVLGARSSVNLRVRSSWRKAKRSAERDP
eukprot:scaffold166358_cov23-Tisochrysis_lutea.AAC.1